MEMGLKQKIDNIDGLLEAANSLYSVELKRHNDAAHPLNVLSLLVDLGYTRKDGLEPVYQQMMKNRSEDAFAVVLNISPSFGGSGKPITTWLSCDAPLTTYIAIKLNEGKIEAQHKTAIQNIASLKEANGWRCKGGALVGRFRGPGRKDDECPIAMLQVLKMLSVTPQDEYTEEKQLAISALWKLWSERKKRKAYLFGMGTDFCKLKYPMIWYDLLHVVSVLSRYPEAVGKMEFGQMLGIIRDTVKENGYKPQSIYTAWKAYDFGQKKADSVFIKAEVEAIEERVKTLGK